MKTRITLFFISLFLALTAGQADNSTLAVELVDGLAPAVEPVDDLALAAEPADGLVPAVELADDSTLAVELIDDLAPAAELVDDLAPDVELVDDSALVDELVDELVDNLASIAETVDELALTDLTDWYVDAVNGDDVSGTGSMEEPFRSIKALLKVNKAFPDFVSGGDTVHLAIGDYSSEDVVIDIAQLKIEGTLDEQLIPGSVLGKVKILADEVTLSNCMFLDAGLTLQNVEGVLILNNLFSGTTKNSLTLLGSSSNSISNNQFDSATESCVVIRNDSAKPSNDNVFRENYFTHHPEKTTEQIVMVNPSSLFEGLFGKNRLSARNRFIKCAFEEIVPGQLERVIEDYSTWQIVVKDEYSLKFEDCYFKRADRNVPFISFMIIGERPTLSWYWDELANDSWVVSNDEDLLTGNKKNDFVPAIQFVDWDGDGLMLETKYFAGLMRSTDLLPSDPTSNRPPAIINLIADIAVYKNAAPSEINLFDVFEDDVTTDESLNFSVSCDNTSLVSSELKDGILTLIYAQNREGIALVTVTATDDDSFDPQSSEDSFHVIIIEGSVSVVSERNDWYVDSVKGDDAVGTGSESDPFKSIDRVLAIYAEQPDRESTVGTIHLSKGNYNQVELEIGIPGLSIQGTLDKHGRPVSILGDTTIVADGVKLSNCNFVDASLTLMNVEEVLVSNNVFSGDVGISLSLLGASNNTIQHCEFSSAIHDSVHIFWDSVSRKSSNGNVFFRNYFTHRSKSATNRVIRVKWFAGANDSISARNRFVECAFKETKPERLLRVIDDDSTWWMVADHRYSVMFEDCYFKRADRKNPFSEFVILKGHPDYTWRWDELINDKWVSVNGQWAITGDHSGWNHKPRVRFADKNENGTAFESAYEAGLLSIHGNDAE